MQLISNNQYEMQFADKTNNYCYHSPHPWQLLAIIIEKLWRWWFMQSFMSCMSLLYVRCCCCWLDKTGDNGRLAANLLFCTPHLGLFYTYIRITLRSPIANYYYFALSDAVLMICFHCHWGTAAIRKRSKIGI